MPVEYKLVPVEPTLEMRKAYHEADDNLNNGIVDECSPDHQWAAMLAATPAPVEYDFVTIQSPDPYDERSGYTTTHDDYNKLANLPAGTRLYIQRPAPAEPAITGKALEELLALFNLRPHSERVVYSRMRSFVINEHSPELAKRITELKGESNGR